MFRFHDSLNIIQYLAQRPRLKVLDRVQAISGSVFILQFPDSTGAYPMGDSQALGSLDHSKERNYFSKLQILGPSDAHSQ